MHIHFSDDTDHYVIKTFDKQIVFQRTCTYALYIPDRLIGEVDVTFNINSVFVDTGRMTKE